MNNLSSNGSVICCPVGYWDKPVSVGVSNFAHKSLCDFNVNIAVGCQHGCPFCYVPKVATVKMRSSLESYGVRDPDLEWGKYLFLRPLNRSQFTQSVREADLKPASALSRDGHRAVMLSSTTDPYQVIRHPDAAEQIRLNEARADIVRQILEIIRDESSLNVRILTRSPLVRKDFDLLKSFGNRLTLGMSIPTLRDDLSRLYEPGAPSPRRRLETLQAASEAGISVYVAIAPTFPETDYDDMVATLEAIKTVNPITVFHEPINIRGENVRRIAASAEQQGIPFQGHALETEEGWVSYALKAFADMERAAKVTGLYDRLHLWIDSEVGGREVALQQPSAFAHTTWAEYWWFRVSEWPGKCNSKINTNHARMNPYFNVMTREEVAS